MKKTRELRGMPVLALQEGERLGQVRDIILDPAARQIVALILDRRVGGEDQVVATANIRSVGPAAITVESRGSLVSLSRIPRFQELVRMGKPIRGKMVISESGERLGQVDDLEVDVETFHLVSLALKSFWGRGQAIPTDRVRTIGADAIVVCAEKPEGAATEAPAPPFPEPAPPPAPAPAPILPPDLPPAPILPPDLPPAPALPSLTPLPGEEPAPVSAPIPALAGEPLPVLPPAESAPPPEGGAAPAGEPAAAAPPADPEADPAETPAEEEGENAWQRWVRRLKNG